MTASHVPAPTADIATLNPALHPAPSLADAHHPLRALKPDAGRHHLTLVPHAELRPSPLNPRKTFDQEKLRNLALSIYNYTEFGADQQVTESGVLVPLIARRTAAGSSEIAAGERRWRAVQLLIEGFNVELGGHTVHFQVPATYPVPVLYRELSDADMREVALIENVQREGLSELEEADLFVACRSEGMSVEDIAHKNGLSRATVERRVTLGFGLGRDGRRLLEEGRITLAHAHILALTSGALKQTLIKAAKDGMSVKEMQAIVSRGTVLVEHAVFDVAASGLTVVASLFDVDLPERFSDPKAALACQLDALNAQAQQHREQTGEWAEVLGVDTAPQVLPDAYLPGAHAPRGNLYTYSLVTGQVHVHRGVSRVADRPVPAPRTSSEALQAPPRPETPAPDRRRSLGVRESVLSHLETLRMSTLIDTLMAHPHAGLVNVIMQTLSRGGNIQVGGMTGAQKKSAPGAQRYAADLVANHPELFVSHSAGSVSLRADVTSVQAFEALLTWPVDTLLPLLTFLTCASAYEPGSEYMKAVADRTGAQEALASRFQVTDELLENHTAQALRELVASMPEPLRPITMETTGKRELKALILDRRERLARAGWVPTYVRY